VCRGGGEAGVVKPVSAFTLQSHRLAGLIVPAQPGEQVRTSG
jgi:hypothetical protein